MRRILIVVFATILSALSISAQHLKSQPFDLKGCIQTHFDKSFVIKDQKSFLKAVRDDMSRERCLQNLEKIDFEKHALVGIELNTGYCRVPPLDPIQVVKNESEKQFVVKISYVEPREPCRALSQYDLWLLVPKLPADYTVKFEVKGKPFPGRN
ncbi:MAG TPA: hypothetical protein VIL74_23075 [Pyrinomonadaceae bacterium]